MKTAQSVAKRDENRSGQLTKYLAITAFCAGVFFRFWDLGGAPLAVDEYFFGTSMLNIIKHGLPQFDCAGFYTRGVLVQYLSVPLLQFGSSLEFATRFWPAVASILSVAAVWRISMIVGGRRIAYFAVILTSLSLWEIEFARFGRMYAPFQAVFLWYVFFQIAHLIQGRDIARWNYLGLSALSIFVYEGAALLLAFNFMPLIWPGRRWSVTHLAIALGLLIVGVWSQMVDFRYLGVAIDQLPPATSESSGSLLPVSLPALPETVLLLIPVGIFFLVLTGWRYRAGLRPQHPSVLYWILVASCLCLGLLGVGLALTLVGLLLPLPNPLQPVGNRAKSLFGPLIILTLVWITTLFFSFSLEGDSVRQSVKATLSYLLNYPDIYYKVFLPWIQAIPVTTVGLGFFSLFGLQAAFSSRQPTIRHNEALRYVIATIILLILIVAVLKQPFRTTRYTYFLYPLILIVASAGINHLTQARKSNPRMRSAIAALLLIVLMVLAEDFRLIHLLEINEPQYRFRTAHNERLAGHYYIRWDYRSAASFVNQNIAVNDEVVVFDQPLPHYLERTSGIFIREGTNNHAIVWGCGGERDLWSNAPLLDRVSELEQLIEDATGAVWLIMPATSYRWLDPIAASFVQRYDVDPVFQSPDRSLDVYHLMPDT